VKSGMKRELAETCIDPEAMETISDVLLRSSPGDGEYPAYTEEQIGRKSRRTALAEEYFVILSAMKQTSEDPSLRGHAGLTPAERSAFEMYYEGYASSEIAGLLGVSKPTALRLLKSAVRRMTARRADLRDVSHVYHCEVHRRAYRKPSHCREKPCGRLGYCKYPFL